MSNAKVKAFDLKALTLNTLIVVLCIAPVLGWVCFMLVALVYLVAAYRLATSRAHLSRSISAIAGSVAAYFSAYWLHSAVADRHDYLSSIATTQAAVVLTLVLYFHFRIYKSR